MSLQLEMSRRSCARQRNARYNATDKGKLTNRKSVTRYQGTEKGRIAKRRADRRYSATATGRDRNKKAVQTFKRTPKGKAWVRFQNSLRRAGRNNPDRKHIRAVYDRCEVLRLELGLDLVVDHTIPLSRGGKHVSSNLQIITRKENLKKSNRTDYVVATVYQ